MKGDFTRNTFQPDKHYDRVLVQQGRVQLDADWNENVAILTRHDRTAMEDIVGSCGGPADGAAFRIITDAATLDAIPATDDPPKQFALSKGRYYVDGIQCEVENDFLFSRQPDHREDGSLATGSHVIYLEAWHRHITAIEDPEIREPALGGPDTSTRVRTVWQVRAKSNGASNCSDSHDTVAGLERSTLPQLKARVVESDPNAEPCTVPAAAGYRGLENQLYRVEIHEPAVADADGAQPATYKWSRDNGSVVTAVTALLADHVVQVASTGPDDVLGFRSGDLVELLDDENDLEGTPGQLAIVDGSPNGNRIKLKARSADPGDALPAVFVAEPTRHAKLRRWDGFGKVERLAANDGYIELESKIEVRFDSDGDGYRVGDYWLIPARTSTKDAASGDIEWPRDPADDAQPMARPPLGITRHYCALGVITIPDEVGAVTAKDCRCLWPSLASIPRLFYVSGDGQEVMPVLPADPNTLVQLHHPLIVAVANPHCVERPNVDESARGVSVHFEVLAPGSGKVVVAEGGQAAASVTADVEVDAQGLARCDFFLDSSTPTQQVMARLLDIAGDTVSPPIIFNASLSQASTVACDPSACPDLVNANVTTVQGAINELCKRKDEGGIQCDITVGRGGRFEKLQEALNTLLNNEATQVCICLLPGIHEIADLKIGLEKSDVRLKISGCGWGAKILVKQNFALAGLDGVILRDLAVVAGGKLFFENCNELEIDACSVIGVLEREPLITVNGAERITLTRNRISARAKRELHPADRILEPFSSLIDLVKDSDDAKFSRRVIEEAKKVAAIPPAARRAFVTGTTPRLDSIREKIGLDEVSTYETFLTRLTAEAPDLQSLIRDLRAIRAVGIRAVSGLAIVVDSVNAHVVIEDNDVVGTVSFYGVPGRAELLAGTIDSLRGRLSQNLQLTESPGTVQIHANRIDQLLVGERMLADLEGESDGKRGVPVYQALFLGHNVLSVGANLLLARHVSLNSNRFRDRRTALGASVADSAVYVGNSAAVRALWSNVSRVTPESAANVLFGIT